MIAFFFISFESCLNRSYPPKPPAIGNKTERQRDTSVGLSYVRSRQYLFRNYTMPLVDFGIITGLTTEFQTLRSVLPEFTECSDSGNADVWVPNAGTQ